MMRNALVTQHITFSQQKIPRPNHRAVTKAQNNALMPPMIGVFDSGFGGLTVLKAITEALPQADFVYLGDNKNAPYGTRPPIDVLTLTCVGVERLFARGCSLVIVACNTASTVALNWIQTSWLPIQGRSDGVARNVLGIVAPTIEAVTRDPAAPTTIAVFATERTVLTETYPTELQKRRADLRVYQQPCPQLVRLIENGAPESELRPLVQKYTAELYEQMGRTWPERVILGCTHYSLIPHLFAECLPKGTPVIDQQEVVAASLLDYVRRHPEYNIGNSGQRTFLASEFNPALEPVAARFWGGPVTFETF